MGYDQEISFWKCSTMHEDLDSMLDLLLKTTLKEKYFSVFDSKMLEENKNMELTIDD